MKICQVGVQLFHIDGRVDRQDEDNSLFCNFTNAPKIEEIHLV